MFQNQIDLFISKSSILPGPNRSPIHSIADSGSNLIDSIRKQIHGQPINVGSLDVSLLKKQYVKLKQRQRQVQIILKGKLT